MKIRNFIGGCAAITCSAMATKLIERSGTARKGKFLYPLDLQRFTVVARAMFGLDCTDSECTGCQGERRNGLGNGTSKV